jgi:hypothetical protein
MYIPIFDPVFHCCSTCCDDSGKDGHDASKYDDSKHKEDIIVTVELTDKYGINITKGA